MPSSLLTYRYRIKDATKGKHLQRLAWACNTVWNFCNEVSLLALRRDKRWLTAIDLINLTAGASTELGLHSETISEICREYVAKRKASHKRRLKWRSRQRSLGWVPFKMRFLKWDSESLTYLKRRYRFWASRPIEGTPKTGSFTQDARGRWYVTFQCEVESPGVPTGQSEIGIDLGLKDQVVCSDGITYSRENLTRKHEDALARVQRAHKARRVTAIHAKIANARKDWAQKTSTAIVRRTSTIVVGNVSPSQLAKTRLAKSVLDAGWSQFRSMLAYKAMRLGVNYCDVNESGSTVTCSTCGARTGPRGLGNLGVRDWCCTSCGVVHDRDINAAHNILRLGRETLSGIPRL